MISELEPPTSTRRAKKRKVVREAEGDPWEQDSVRDTQGNTDLPRQETHDKGITGDVHHTTMQPEPEVNGQTSIPGIEPVDVDAMEVPTATPKPTAKGKRGQKKKGKKSQEPAPDLIEPTPPTQINPEPAAAPSGTTEHLTKRKRGRPRKPEVSKPQVEHTDEQEQVQQPTEEDAQAQTTEAAEEDTPPQPLSELHHNSQPCSAAGAKEYETRDADQNSKENNSVPASKEGTGPDTKSKGKDVQAVGKDLKAGVQKVRYRVGLSKRSRIAPLLKCLKKPE